MFAAVTLSDKLRRAKKYSFRMFLAACFFSTVTNAQTYPLKTVRIINPFSPGGSLDLVARILSKYMAAELGQQVIVENKPGAGGNIGVEYVAKSQADGYTLLIVQSSITVNPVLQTKIAYDPVRDFDSISKVSSYMFFLVSHASLPVRSIEQLIALAKAKPGQINYASVGVGSGTHMAAELFNAMAKTRMVHIPYKGTGQVMPDLLGGQVALHFGSTTVVPHVKSGRLIALGVTGAKRSSVLPNVPTISEVTLPGYEVTAWNALFAPASTPPQIIAKLNELVKKAMHTPESKGILVEQGLDVDVSSPAELATLVKSDLAKWTRVIKSTGLKVE